MQNQAPHDPDKLLSQVQHCEQIARNLIKLTHSQLEAIEQADYSTVEALLSQKQHLIDQLAEVADLREACRHITENQPQPVQDKLLIALQTFDDLMIVMSDAEQESINLMQTRQRETAEQLRTLSQQKAVSTNYKPDRQTNLKSRIDISS